ncbi:MAG: thioredoxin [Planctomycetaceae bacterium]
MLAGGCMPGSSYAPDEYDAAAERAGVVTLTDADFDEQVLESEQLVLVDFWAPWCGPCLRFAPTVVELAEEYRGRAVIARIDTDENPEMAARYGVSAIPLVLVFHEGEIVFEAAGVHSKEELAAELDRLLEQHSGTATAMVE